MAFQSTFWFPPANGDNKSNRDAVGSSDAGRRNTCASLQWCLLLPVRHCLGSDVSVRARVSLYVGFLGERAARWTLWKGIWMLHCDKMNLTLFHSNQFKSMNLIVERIKMRMSCSLRKNWETVHGSFPLWEYQQGPVIMKQVARSYVVLIMRLVVLWRSLSFPLFHTPTAVAPTCCVDTAADHDMAMLSHAEREMLHWQLVLSISILSLKISTRIDNELPLQVAWLRILFCSDLFLYSPLLWLYLLILMSFLEYRSCCHLILPNNTLWRVILLSH